jgi:hypothetical protein
MLEITNIAESSYSYLFDHEIYNCLQNMNFY